MVTNLNNLIRKTISSAIEKNTDILSEFYSLETEEQIKLVRLFLSDHYKLSYYYYKKEPDLFNNIEEDENKKKIDTIVQYCLHNSDMLYDLMFSTKLFYDMDFVGKCVLMQDMENNDLDKQLTSINVLHILDRITYQIEDDMEHYKKYYKNFLHVHKDLPNRMEIICNFIIGRLSDLKNNDQIKYNKYILEMLKVYYKWRIFIKGHDKSHLLNKEDFVYTDIIENKSIEEIINNFDNNFDFAFTVVNDYFHYTTEKIEVKEKIVDRYFEAASSDELKKKFK